MVSGLERVVLVSESAKQLRKSALQVRLLALDAIVQSQRADDRLLGFDEVASQMRNWSQDLQDALKLLIQEIGDVVTFSSVRIKSARAEALWRAASLGGRAARAGRTFEDLAQRGRAEESELQRRWRRVHQRTQELDQLALMAVVLSRSSLIEATYANPQIHEKLEFVARSFAANAERVVQIIKTLVEAAQAMVRA